MPSRSVDLSPKPIQMTPDRTIEWNRHQLGSVGTLYTQPTITPDDLIVSNLLTAATRDFSALPDADYLGHGATAQAYRLGDYVIRRALSPRIPDKHVGLGAVRASVALSAGLERLMEQGYEQLHYSAPMPLACLVNSDQKSSVHNAVVMPYAEGIHPRLFSRKSRKGLPNLFQRRRVYHKAVNLTDTKPRNIYFDDQLLNLKVTYDDEGYVNKIIKLDVEMQ